MKTVKKIATKISKNFPPIATELEEQGYADFTEMYHFILEGNPTREDQLEALTEDPTALIIIQLVENLFLISDSYKGNPSKEEVNMLFGRMLLLGAACGHYIHKNKLKYKKDE